MINDYVCIGAGRWSSLHRQQYLKSVVLQSRFGLLCFPLWLLALALNRNVRQGTGAPARDFGFRHFIEPLKEKEATAIQPFHLDSIKLRSQGSIPVTQSLPGLEIGCWPCCCFSEDIFGHPLRTFQTLRVRGFSFLLLLLGQRLQPQDGWFSTRLVWGKWGAWVTNAEINLYVLEESFLNLHRSQDDESNAKWPSELCFICFWSSWIKTLVGRRFPYFMWLHTLSHVIREGL